MKIAVLNECFLSKQHLNYLRSLGTLDIYHDTTDATKASQRIADADIVLGDMYDCPLNADVLGAANNLKLLAINSTGFDLVDLSAAKARGIIVTNVPGFGTEAVAEHGFALLLSLIRHIAEGDRAMRNKPFQINPGDASHTVFKGFNLAGKTLGIYGLGAIGSHIAQIGRGFGMNVIYYNRSAREEPGAVSVDDLLAQSDVLSLHAPLNDASRNIINANTLLKMKKTAVLINTGRGGCVSSDDLAQALETGMIAGAGLDILDDWSLDNPLLKAPNCVLTPHAAWYTHEALDKIGDIMIANIQSYVAGKPQNTVA